MSLKFTVTADIPASPDAIYNAWLDSDGHSIMTGSPAHVTSNVGGLFDAWDGYLNGKNLDLVPGERIVQAWRGRDYTESDGFSKIEVTLSAVAGGTRITLVHSNVPDNQTTHEAGWATHYFEPMKKYFSSPG